MTDRTNTPAPRPHLARDQQQWIYDYIVQQSGLVFHWWSGNKRSLPETVRSHAMISKHIGREAQGIEREALDELALGNRERAQQLFFSATERYMRAQHVIFENNAEKQFLYQGLRRSYDQVRELTNYRIERIDVPWNGTTLSGFLHVLPGDTPAPLIFYIPGSDITCETWPTPWNNVAHQRGMHAFCFDGPGQGQSNMRDITLTATNYEEAASAVIDHLVGRPEIDEHNIVVYAAGMGGFWGLRLAATDQRIKAAATKSSYTDKFHLMDEDSPRWKRMFAYLTHSANEAELDAVANQMTLHGYMEKITCPVLMVSGEYDLRDPIEEVYDLFDELASPAELWVFADQFHQVSLANKTPIKKLMLDWMRDRVDNRPMHNAGEVIYIEPGDEGPNAPDAKKQRRWFEEPS